MGRPNRRAHVGRRRLLVGLAALCATTGAMPTAPAPARYAGSFCEILRFHGDDQVRPSPTTDAWGQWCDTTPSAASGLPIQDITLGALGTADQARKYLATFDTTEKGFQPLDGVVGDLAVATTRAPYSDSTEVKYTLAFVRSCVYVQFVSDAAQPSDPSWAERIRTVQATAREIDSRIRAGRYGVPSCSGSDTDTSPGDDWNALLEAVVEGGVFTKAELVQITREHFPTSPMITGSQDQYWALFGAEYERWKTEFDKQILDHALITNTRLGQVAVDAQATVWTAVLFSTAQPGGKSEFPALKALLPVVMKMAATAIGPPANAQAGVALNRLVRLSINLEIPGFSTSPPTS